MFEAGTQVNSNSWELQRYLRRGVAECSIRCLYQSALWAAEQLVGIPDPANISQNEESDNFINDGCKSSNTILLAVTLLSLGQYQRCSHLMRKSFRQDSGRPNSVESSSFGLFLGCYSHYLAGEKLKDQTVSEAQYSNQNAERENSKKESQPVNGSKKSKKKIPMIDLLGNNDSYESRSRNAHLRDIYLDLAPLYCDDDDDEEEDATNSSDKTSGKKKLDGFLLYLFGVVVKILQREDGLPNFSGSSSRQFQSQGDLFSRAAERLATPNARQIFLESLRIYPWNWSCWLELSELCIVEKSAVPTWAEFVGSNVFGEQSSELYSESFLYGARIMYINFLIHIYLEKHQGEQAMQAIECVVNIFPTSSVLFTQVGLSHYSLRNYDKAQESFELLRDRDPYRLNHIDTYSNILYVKEKHAELSHLAHVIVKIDKFSPEACCIVGNYYSLKGKHERAVLYFQRALKLDKTYLSAWTLMGHEYMELRNTAAAVQCYRMAVDISETDYRAWYGLGQTYEMLHLYHYACYYYKKAAYLRPTDARMWCAVGSCTLKLGMNTEAVVILERAVACGDREGIATRDLARLYRDEGLLMKAAEFYLKYLQTNIFEMEPLAVQLLASFAGKANKAFNGPSTSDDTIVAATAVAGIGEQALAVVDSEQAEAILYLATYYKKIGSFGTAEFFCNRLLGFIGPEGDEARAILREIRNHQAQAISAAGKRVAGPTPLQQPLSSAFQSISPVASFFGSHSSSQDYHSPRSTMRKVSSNAPSRNITLYDSGFKGRDIHVDETRAEDVGDSSHNSPFSGTRTSLNASMALLSDSSANTSSVQRFDEAATLNLHDDSAQHMSESGVEESSDRNGLDSSQMMSFSDGEQQHYPYYSDTEALSQVAGDAIDYSYFEGIEYDEDMELQRALALSLIEGGVGDDVVDMQFADHITEPTTRRVDAVVNLLQPPPEAPPTSTLAQGQQGSQVRAQPTVQTRRQTRQQQQQSSLSSDRITVRSRTNSRNNPNSSNTNNSGNRR